MRLNGHNPKRKEGKKRRRKIREVGRKVNYEGGYRGELIRLLLTSGTLSYRGLHMLPGEHRLYTRKIKDMEEDGLVDVLCIGKRRTGSQKAVRLKNFNERYPEYIAQLPKGYYGYYMRYGKKNADDIGKYTSERTRAEKAYRESEIVALMYGADIPVLKEEKKDLSCDGYINTSETVYYSCREIKHADNFQLAKSTLPEDGTIINTRILGCLISPGGAYAVYHSGKSLMNWSRFSENQIAYSLSKIIYSKREIKEDSESGLLNSCIIYAYRKEIFKSILENKKKNLLQVNCGYKSMYAIPYTIEGQYLTKFMTEPEWERKFKLICLPEYNYDTNHMPLVCDGTRESVITLLFCIPDLIKLYKFIMALSFTSDINPTHNTYEICCFDFQRDFIDSLEKQSISVKELPFWDFERQFTMMTNERGEEYI